MNHQLSPIISEFETAEAAAKHDSWFRSKVKNSLANPGKGTPHDQVMAQMDAIIENIEARKRASV